MEVTCHLVQINFVLAKKSEEVCREDSLGHRPHKDYTLKFTVAQIPQHVIIQAFPGDINKADGADILSHKACFGGPRGRLNVSVKFLS